MDMAPFDLLGPLPTPRSTTVLEASAGTGKTFALAGLVTRYVAEGVATLDQMLLITFGRAASQELRERVRSQILDALLAFDDPASAGDNQLVTHLLDGTPDELAERKLRLRDALAGFDAATIATTHQFCQLVLKSLGVAGDTDAGVQLVESLDDVVTEIVDDLYLAHFGQQKDDPMLTREQALDLARQVVGKRTHRTAADRPGARLRARRPCRLRESRVRGAGDAQAQARHPALRRPALPARERPGARRFAGPGTHAAALVASSWSTSSRTPTRCSGR